jgi:hypothetical protein
MTRLASLITLLLLVGCRDDRPPAPTAEEAARLNETEAMLNNVARTQEGPEARAPGPSNSN